MGINDLVVGAQWAFRFAMFVGAIVGVEFIISYHTKSGGSWVETRYGRVSMRLMGSLGLVFVLVSLRILSIWTKSHLWDAATYVLGALGTLAVIWAMVSTRRLMGQLQEEAARTHRERNSSMDTPQVIRSSEVTSPTIPIFGREPALLITTTGSALALLVALGIPGFSDLTVTAINSVIFFGIGAYAAVKTRPFEPMAIVAVVGPVAQLIGAYGFHIDPAVVTGVQAVVLSVLQFVIRSQVTPKNNPLPTAPEVGPVA